jgi:hypothetical protein
MRKALIIGAGRIGAGYLWTDDAYTHAGAYRALKDRVDLIAFVEPNPERADAAEKKWGVTAYETLEEALTSWKPSIVSVCTQPEDQINVMSRLEIDPNVEGIWCEKPYMGFPSKKAVQVNYMRRGDPDHTYYVERVWTDRLGNKRDYPERLIVYGKDDLTTRCHFEDLAKWWECQLDYRPFQGPCAYIVETSDGTHRFFDHGGVNGGDCFKQMLGNLLDHLDLNKPLWSPHE